MGPVDPVLRIIAYVISGLLIAGFFWYHARRQRKRDKVQTQQRARERIFRRRRAHEQLEDWATGVDEEPGCGICRGALGEDPKTCPSCGAGFHAPCWEASDGCNSCGYRISIMEERA
jgi:hypothetical protein